MKYLLLSMLFFSCATEQLPLHPKKDSVKVGEESAPPGAHELGEVWGDDGRGCGARGIPGTYEAALDKMKNRAAHMGATYVRITYLRRPHFLPPACHSNHYKVLGIAYQ